MRSISRRWGGVEHHLQKLSVSILVNTRMITLAHFLDPGVQEFLMVRVISVVCAVHNGGDVIDVTRKASVPVVIIPRLRVGHVRILLNPAKVSTPCSLRPQASSSLLLTVLAHDFTAKQSKTVRTHPNRSRPPLRRYNRKACAWSGRRGEKQWEV